MDLKALREEVHKLSALVDGWNSCEEIPALERDLALEKLRALYDAVRFAAEGAGRVEAAPVEAAAEPIVPISLDLGDILSLDPLPVEVAEPESGFAAAPVSEPEPEQAAEPEPEPVAEPLPAPVAEPESRPNPEPVLGSLFGKDEAVDHRRRQRVIMELYGNSQSSPVREAKAAVAGQPAPEELPVAEMPGEEEVVIEEITIEQIAVETSAAFSPEPLPAQPEAAPAAEQEEEFIIEQIAITPGAVLGEVMNHDVQTLADTISAPRDIASEIRRHEPVGDLRTAVGINDRFLLIRDLFEGDSDVYEEVLATLNGFDNLDDCMIYIAENYIWNSNSDGAKLLTELLERKFA